MARAGALRVHMYVPRSIRHATDVGTSSRYASYVDTSIRYALSANDQNGVYFGEIRHVETLSQSEIERYTFLCTLKSKNSESDSPAKTPENKSLISYPVRKVAKASFLTLAVFGAHTTLIYSCHHRHHHHHQCTSKCCSRI